MTQWVKGLMCDHQSEYASQHPHTQQVWRCTLAILVLGRERQEDTGAQQAALANAQAPAPVRSKLSKAKAQSSRRHLIQTSGLHIHAHTLTKDSPKGHMFLVILYRL